MPSPSHSNTSKKVGILYVVATPIGNLADISQRAQETLASVDMIYAEDTRHSSYLLTHLNIHKPLQSLHEHNEHERIALIKEKLNNGLSLALISDAGTPLISDPGFALVRALRSENFHIIPIPGCSAVITALCVSGIPTDRFCFEGFLPAKTSARKTQIQSLAQESRSLVFYESSHRIIDALRDLTEVLGENRLAFIGREMTKKFEEYRNQPLNDLYHYFKDNKSIVKGEFVIVIEGNKDDSNKHHQEVDVKKLLTLLMAENMPVKKAVEITVKMSGLKKNMVYKIALEMANS